MKLYLSIFNIFCGNLKFPTHYTGEYQTFHNNGLFSGHWPHVYLVDHPGAESPLQGHLVYDHGVLHVIAGVRDDGDNGVRAHGIVVQPDVVVVRRPEEG